MVLYAAHVLNNAIALTSVEPRQQPAGGWGNWTEPPIWIEPVNPVGATIYTFTALDISRLKDNGLISDESALYYRLRLANISALPTFTIVASSLLLTGARIYRALTRLQGLGLIKRFSISEMQLSWIKTSIALPEAQIRNDWATKISDDKTYVWQVLNLLRNNSTTSSVDLVNLYPSWSITNQMLGEAIAYLSGTEVNALTCTLGNLTTEFSTPIPTTGISREELTTLYNLSIIGDAQYTYFSLRSVLNNKSQVVSPGHATTWGYSLGKLLNSILSLKEQNIITSLDINQVTIQWVTPRQLLPTVTVFKQKRSYFKDAGLFVYTVASFATSDTQSLSLIDITKLCAFKKLIGLSESQTGLNYLFRGERNGSYLVKDCQPFTITWA